MKILRIILIIMIIIWMIIIFKFSSQKGTKSQGTSSSVTKFFVNIFYKDNEKIDEKIKKFDPIIRKIAHYTAYLIRRNVNCRSYIHT
ncbi:MAG: VanZ family protein [Clostridia bacterium]|jgi:VanZ family protein|nr:VanZ family protein [Clostridia bacterium]